MDSDWYSAKSNGQAFKKQKQQCFWWGGQKNGKINIYNYKHDNVLF